MATETCREWRTKVAHEEGSELDEDLIVGVPGDLQIEIEVKDALAWEERLDAKKIQVGVCGGAVMLMGDVRSREEKELAENIVWGVRGVTDVSNELRVAGESQKAA